MLKNEGDNVEYVLPLKMVCIQCTYFIKGILLTRVNHLVCVCVCPPPTITGGIILAVIEGVGIAINRAVAEQYKPGKRL